MQSIKSILHDLHTYILLQLMKLTLQSIKQRIISLTFHVSIFNSTQYILYFPFLLQECNSPLLEEEYFLELITLGFHSRLDLGCSLLHES